MERDPAKIIIIGGGISGLVAAKVLESSGYAPIIIEASDNVGGRVKTSMLKGYSLDHGFQVLLTAYPQAKKHLDYSSLDLRYFKPGALLFQNGAKQQIGDPLRDFSSFLPTLRTTAALLSDKWKIFRLSNRLKKKSIDAIFCSPETTTKEYLRSLGFSERVLQSFFVPFFTGIFLEENLDTSSRMFEFVFKMFSEGAAAIPQKGIGEIAMQLKGQLKRTQILYDTQVSHIKGQTVECTNGTSREADKIICTVPYDSKTGELNPNLNWKGCDTLYFECPHSFFSENLIGLISEERSLVNNINYHFSPDKNPLLSVTVVKSHTLNTSELEEQIREELKKHCKISVGNLIHCFKINKALPRLESVRMEWSSTYLKVSNTLYLAGDHLLNGSLQAAMEGGESAAVAVISDFQDKTESI